MPYNSVIYCDGFPAGAGLAAQRRSLQEPSDSPHQRKIITPCTEGAVSASELVLVRAPSVACQPETEWATVSPASLRCCDDRSPANKHLQRRFQIGAALLVHGSHTISGRLDEGRAGTRNAPMGTRGPSAIRAPRTL